MNLHVDLGQVIITAAISIIGYLTVTQITDFKKQLTRHQEILFNLVGDVQRLIGIYEGWNGGERRNKPPSNGRKSNGG